MARILIVDDEPDILRVLNFLLQAEGHEVVAANGGEQARDILGSPEGLFDLMLSDIRMTPMSGMDLLRIAHDLRPDMTVIMLTAFGQVDTAIEAMQLGAFDYVRKPFRASDLLNTVKKALESRPAPDGG